MQCEPTYDIKYVQGNVKDKYRYAISYNKAWHNLKRARKNVYGIWEGSCQYLPKYIGALQKYNPGTVEEWFPNEIDGRVIHILQYVLWAFRSCIECFRHCLKVISVDGTHLYTKYKHKMLIDASLDANQHVLPLAYAIVDEKNFRSWHWFLHMVTKFVIHGVKGMCLISDRHPDIIKIVERVREFQAPMGLHRFCLRHVTSNFNNHYKNISLKNLCWQTGSELSVHTFEKIMEQIKPSNPDACEYLLVIDPCLWILCYDEGNR
ncbi:hypothetical protein DH2020_027528 [Rehmannia glutinosa]|uniref:MULE transposase domain-containing protein n=1 Tax=Rehmannia glutinosa TaxID=99300 RepID=A0ABR0VTX9_REHGL